MLSWNVIFSAVGRLLQFPSCYITFQIGEAKALLQFQVWIFEMSRKKNILLYSFAILDVTAAVRVSLNCCWAGGGQALGISFGLKQ